MLLFFREELLQLRSENAELRGLLKEQKSAECKEKESPDASGNSSDGQAELRKSLETLQTEAKCDSEVIKLLKEWDKKKQSEMSDGQTGITADKITPKGQSQLQSEKSNQHVTRQRVSLILLQKWK